MARKKELSRKWWRLDAGLRHLAEIVKRDMGVDVAEAPGAGAAGGCGYGMLAFFGARREGGFDLVRRVTKLDDLVAEHDLVVTGEGRFDETSLHGKASDLLGRVGNGGRQAGVGVLRTD